MKSLPTYSTLQEKASNFKQTKVDSYKDWEAVYQKLSSSGGIFRGIDNSAYKIYTSLQRQILLNDLVGKFSLHKYIDNFRKNDLLRNYLQTFKISPSKLSIYSYLQHYGAPTPYLDFTYNLDKALYFAIEKIDSSTVENSDSIEDYFSIFHIEEPDLELLQIPEVIKSLKDVKKYHIEALSHYEDYSTDLMITHIDTIFSINTCNVFLIENQEEFHDIYNTFNNIRIIAQEGLFVYNDYHDKPLEIALKEFFIEATMYLPSPWDEMDTPQAREINAEYEVSLKRNREFQKRLNGNIIHSYEIHKSLKDEILKNFHLKKEDIYPDEAKLCWEIFQKTKL